jgi:hypothetical protein
MIPTSWANAEAQVPRVPLKFIVEFLLLQILWRILPSITPFWQYITPAKAIIRIKIMKIIYERIVLKSDYLFDKNRIIKALRRKLKNKFLYRIYIKILRESFHCLLDHKFQRRLFIFVKSLTVLSMNAYLL